MRSSNGSKIETMTITTEPEIPENTDVWVTTNGCHITGRTVTTSDTPRSYIMETAIGEICRNRSQLNVNPSTTDSSSRQGEDLHRSQILTCSRTGASISPPERLKAPIHDATCSLQPVACYSVVCIGKVARYE